MAINNKPLGTAADPVSPSPGEQVLPKLINHNVTEEHFQEALDDTARQVDQNQIDLGYEADITDNMMGTERAKGTAAARLTTLEAGLLDGGATVGATTATADLEGTIANPQIRTNAVGTDQIAAMAVTEPKIENGAITNEKISEGVIMRDRLDMGLQSFTHTVGTEMPTTINLGDGITVPTFAEDQDGVVTGPTSAEATTNGFADTDDLYVLASDGTWVAIKPQVRDETGALIPASDINFGDRSAHTVTIPNTVSSGTTIPEYLANAATRQEGSPLMSFALEFGDIITVNDERQTPTQVTSFIYQGPAVNATTNAQAADFTAIGVAQTYGVAANGGIEFASGTNNFQLTSTIPGNRTFSGNTTFTGSTTHNGAMVANGNVDLGDAASDTVTVNGVVDSNIIPDGNGTRALGSTAARWDVNADMLNFSNLTGTVGNDNIMTRTVGVDRLNGTAADTGQIATVVPGTDPMTDPNEVAWMDPPIGVQMVTTLASATDVAVGTVVSLTQTDGSNPPGVYRASSVSPTVWQRLGTVGAIVTKQRITSVSGQTSYSTNAIAPAHFITIDGLTLVETGGVDYSVNSNRMGFTLTAAVPAGLDIEISNFSDVATIGDGEVATSALAAGALPSGVTIAGSQVSGAVNTASSAPSTGFTISGWTLGTDASGNLTFSRGGAVRARLDTDGHFHTEDDITAFDNL